MNLQEKIISLRKRNAWSQEELAYKLDVSRQAVSKWESGGSIPDIDKIIQMSEIFHVSTDYLLKNEDEPSLEGAQGDSIRAVSKDEALNHIRLAETSMWKVAIGVVLCIISPVTLLILAGLSEAPYSYFEEDLVAGIGIAVLLSMVAIAVAIFIIQGMKYSKFDYLNKEKIFINSDTKQTIIEKKDAFEGKYITAVSVATVLCILSVIPLIVLACLNINDFYALLGVCILLGIVSIAVCLFIIFGGIHMAFSKLLQQGDYSVENKQRANGIFSGFYWSLITAIYLLVSFLTRQWEYTWIIWPVSAVLYGGIKIVVDVFTKKK